MKSRMPTISISLIVFIAILMGISILEVPAVEASAIPLNWTPSNTFNGFPLASGEAVFDVATGNYVGLNVSRTLTGDGETWAIFDPTNNNPLQPPFGGLVYDGLTKNVLAFSIGGRASDSQSETWTWDGSTWTHLHPPKQGPVRLNVLSLAYDAVMGNVILFGGWGVGGHVFNDTWSWDGITWTELNPASSPPPTDTPTTAYDPVTKSIILFGSGDHAGLNFPSWKNDTWSWDGTTWTKMQPAISPPARVGASLAFDPALGKLILFGGRTTQKLLNDTWSWSGTNWSQIKTANSPSARPYSNLLFDPVKNKFILMGGLDPYSLRLRDMWTFGPKVSARSELSDLTLVFPSAITNVTLPMQTLISNFATNLKEVGITAVSLTSLNYLGSNPINQDLLSAKRLHSVANYLNLELKKIADNKVKITSVNGGSIPKMMFRSDGGVVISIGK